MPPLAGAPVFCAVEPGDGFGLVAATVGLAGALVFAGDFAACDAAGAAALPPCGGVGTGFTVKVVGFAVTVFPGSWPGVETLTAAGFPAAGFVVGAGAGFAAELCGLATIFKVGAWLLLEGFADEAAGELGFGLGLICTGVALTWLLPATDVLDVVDVRGADDWLV